MTKLTEEKINNILKSGEFLNLYKEYKKKIKNELKKEIFNKKQDIIIELTNKLKNVSGNKLDILIRDFILGVNIIIY